jgi:hypothetical protein
MLRRQVVGGEVHRGTETVDPVAVRWALGTFVAAMRNRDASTERLELLSFPLSVLSLV